MENEEIWLKNYVNDNYYLVLGVIQKRTKKAYFFSFGL